MLWRLVKEVLLSELINRSRAELEELKVAAKANRDFATDQEFKAESKYDTRSLEASYLASAEAKRVEEITLEIQLLEEVDLSSVNAREEVSIGSLVELAYKDQRQLYFLIPTAGGTLLMAEGRPVVVVSVFSPIGDAMLGLRQGDEFEVETPRETRQYRILSLL